MSTHLGTTAFLETPTVNGQYVLLNLDNTPSIGQGVALPLASTAGRLFFNTVENILYRDTGSAWVRVSSPIIQVVSGTITPTSGNVIIPYDATTPTSSEGIQIWSQSFTPLRADSTILIATNSFYATSSSADIYVLGATFSGTTCIGAQMLGFTTNSSNGSNFSVLARHTSGSTTTRTYSFRAGPHASATIYVAQGNTSGGVPGVTNQFGGINTGMFSITEIAP